MVLLILFYLKTKRMKLNWKKLLTYLVRFVELLLTGAIGGAAGGNMLG